MAKGKNRSVDVCESHPGSAGADRFSVSIEETQVGSSRIHFHGLTRDSLEHTLRLVLARLERGDDLFDYQ